MRTISLSLTDAVLERSGRCAEALAISRAEYIRRAIQAMNRETEAQLRADRLANASCKVRDESMRVNAEFEAIEHDPDA
jgi:metal-responsive CopG/Arc/MetJ family transcriptional regulator